MPKLMEKADWIRTVENVSRAGSVWSETVDGRRGLAADEFPDGGMYQVIFVRLNDEIPPTASKRKSARDFIGYGRRFHPEYRSTEEIMRELREGEDEQPPEWFAIGKQHGSRHPRRHDMAAIRESIARGFAKKRGAKA